MVGFNSTGVDIGDNRDDEDQLFKNELNVDFAWLNASPTALPVEFTILPVSMNALFNLRPDSVVVIKKLNFNFISLTPIWPLNGCDRPVSSICFNENE